MNPSIPKTKEEILHEKNIAFGIHQDNSLEDICDAMDEWAKQVAMSFHAHKMDLHTDWLEEDFDKFYGEYTAENKQP